jgi:hypothetical protein
LTYLFLYSFPLTPSIFTLFSWDSDVTYIAQYFELRYLWLKHCRNALKFSGLQWSEWFF